LDQNAPVHCSRTAPLGVFPAYRTRFGSVPNSTTGQFTLTPSTETNQRVRLVTGYDVCGNGLLSLIRVTDAETSLL
jgi:hypothetical protein